jgi:uncharacterized protein HemX
MPEEPQPNASPKLSKRVNLVHLALTITSLLAIAFLVFNNGALDQQAITKLKHQQYQLHINQVTAKNVLQNEVESQQSSLQQLQFNVVKLLKTSVQSDRNQQLAIIKSLIYEAQNTLNLNHNFRRALLLLKTAKQKTDQLNQPDTVRLSTDLNSSIEKIEAILQKFNLKDTVIKINHAQSLVQSLSSQTQVKPALLAKPTAHVKNNQHWYSGFETIFNGFKSLIVIERHKTPVNPLPTPSELQTIKNNLNIKFNFTQWALLDHDQDLFQVNLDYIKEKLSRFPTQPKITQISILISALNKLDINPAPPELTGAINSINLLLPTTHKNNPEHKT